MKNKFEKKEIIYDFTMKGGAVSALLEEKNNYFYIESNDFTNFNDPLFATIVGAKKIDILKEKKLIISIDKAAMEERETIPFATDVITIKEFFKMKDGKIYKEDYEVLKMCCAINDGWFQTNKTLWTKEQIDIFNSKKGVLKSVTLSGNKVLVEREQRKYTIGIGEYFEIFDINSPISFFMKLLG